MPKPLMPQWCTRGIHPAGWNELRYSVGGDLRVSLVTQPVLGRFNQPVVPMT
jgi:hypothetical protein